MRFDYTQDLEQFAELLTKKSDTDIGKARAIFVWLCFLDIAALEESKGASWLGSLLSSSNDIPLQHSKGSKDGSSDGAITMYDHIKQLKDETTNYAHLYAGLCR